MQKKSDNKNRIVFFDFDNTITLSDVFDDIVERFSGDDGWKDLEERWKRSEIGSRECLKGQVEGIRVTKRVLDRYLTTIKLDPYFKKLAGLLDSKNIRTIILSDNFDYILNGVLKAHGLDKTFEVYCNSIKFEGNRMVPSFPFSNYKCGNCGHCKKTVLGKIASAGEVLFYIGDGLSDRCASRQVDTVFAKADLKDYLKKEGVRHIPFEELKDVYEHFKEAT
ncbi:MAG: MtnX-like HAD-IB family phosphatase [Candidatus Omnitrophica bacterium]|nr:MtnX-like HAD-IB family phosphatase [Candidatus Omnitrophota bacterium]